MEIIHEIIHVAKSNRFAFPSLDNFNSFRNQKECSNPSFVHSHIYYTIYPKNLRVAKRSLLPELFMLFPIPDLPSFHPKILLSHFRFRFDQINKHARIDRSALPRGFTSRGELSISRIGIESGARAKLRARRICFTFDRLYYV